LKRKRIILNKWQVKSSEYVGRTKFIKGIPEDDVRMADLVGLRNGSKIQLIKSRYTKNNIIVSLFSWVRIALYTWIRNSESRIAVYIDTTFANPYYIIPKELRVYIMYISLDVKMELYILV
jgi:hypothetical protein